MALALDYKEGVLKEIRENPEIAKEYYREAVKASINGETDVTNVMFRALVNADIGFQRLAKETGINAPNLDRTLSSRGNPTLKTFGKIAASISDFLGFKTPMSVFSQDEVNIGHASACHAVSR